MPKFSVLSSFKNLLSVLFSALLFAQANAQYGVNNYFFQQQQGSYSEITGGTVLGDENIDEQVFNASTIGSASIVNGAGFPIGFPFSLGGEIFTRFAVGTNGYINLGNNNFSIANTVASAFTGTPFNQADTAAYANMMAALHADLQGQTGSELSFKTIGTEPNRECVIQWRRFRIYLTTIGQDDFNFQIRLQENGNKIVFSYGAFTMGSQGRKVSVGIRGMAYNIVHMRKAELTAGETWLTSSKSVDRLRQSDIQPAFLPSDGLQYTFYNPARTAADIGLDKASLPANVMFGCPGGTSEAITVRAFNYGDSAQTLLPYQIKINNEPTESGSLVLDPPLLKNQFRVLTLSQTINLSQPGQIQVKIWSNLPGDTGIYAINDTAQINTRIYATESTPYSPANSYPEFIARGWKSYRGKNRPLTPDGRFIAGTQFQSATTAIQMPGFSGDSISDWLVSPALQPLNNLRLKFRASITAFDTISPLIGGIDNDEIRILISDNCGQSWNTLYTFDNSSLSGGVINQQKKGFSVEIPPVSGPFQIAIHANNKGSAPNVNTYFFHLDDLTLNQGNSYDLATRNVRCNNQINPNCALTSFSVTALLKNEGDSSISSTIAQVRVNNNAVADSSFTFSPPLPPGDSAEIVFENVPVNPNSAVKIMVRALHPNEDGFSVANDTASTQFVYIGSANPLPVPLTLNFDNLPSGAPAGWLVEQNQGSDFKVRVRGTGVPTSRSLSALFFSGNSTSYAITPTSATLPVNALLTFDMRIKNDLTGPFNFGGTDSVKVSISTDCGATWYRIFKAKAGQPFGMDNFQTATVNLDAFAGSGAALRFDAVINRSDNTGAWLDIDNIGISSSTEVAGIQNQNDFSFWPNPAKNAIRFSLPKATGNVKARILSADGRILLEEDARDQSELATGNIPAGIYLIEVVSDAGTFRKRLVKE